MVLRSITSINFKNVDLHDQEHGRMQHLLRFTGITDLLNNLNNKTMEYWNYYMQSAAAAASKMPLSTDC